MRSYLSRLFLSFTALLSVAAAQGDDLSHYMGRVPCPTNPDTLGYVNTTKLNEDILLDVQMVIDGEEVRREYQYIFCPGTTFNFKSLNVTSGEESEGDEPIIPAFSNSVFTCGDDGDLKNNCRFVGGDFHVYFADLLVLEYLFMVGIHFEGAKVSSVWGDAHPKSHVYFIDCFFRGNTGVSTAYIHYTPPRRPDRNLRQLETLENYYERAKRKLARGIDIDHVKDLVQNEEKADVPEEMFPSGRDLQRNVKYSMSTIFRNTIFNNNEDELGTILTLGGAVEVQDCKFSMNKVEKMSIMTILMNGHAFIHKNTVFNNNIAKTGPVFIDSTSYLQLSRDNVGNQNQGEQCQELFLESQGSNCYIEGAPCYGECCALGDESCDLYTDDLPSVEPSAAPVGETPPPVDPVPAPTPPTVTPPAPTPAGDRPLPPAVLGNDAGDADNSNGYTPYTPAAGIQQGAKQEGCTGDCMIMAIFFPTFAVLSFIIGCLCLRRSKSKREGPEVSTATEDVVVPEIS